ncbi:MAG: hypothetical protein ACM3S2_06630 [Ignavibacteriales bacterium]
MNEGEKSKLDMFQAVLTYLNEHRELTSSIKAFTWSISKFRKIVEEIKQRQNNASIKALDRSIQIANARDELIMSLLPITQSLYNIAREIKDENLKVRTKLNYNQAVRLKDTELLERALTVVILSEKKISYLRKSGITFPALQNLRLRLGKYKCALEDRAHSNISGNTVTGLNKLFEEAEKILTNYIDNFVEIFAEDFVEFHSGYFYTRRQLNQNRNSVLKDNTNYY